MNWISRRGKQRKWIESHASHIWIGMEIVNSLPKSKARPYSHSLRTHSSPSLPFERRLYLTNGEFCRIFFLRWNGNWAFVSIWFKLNELRLMNLNFTVHYPFSHWCTSSCPNSLTRRCFLLSNISFSRAHIKKRWNWTLLHGAPPLTPSQQDSRTQDLKLIKKNELSYTETRTHSIWLADLRKSFPCRPRLWTSQPAHLCSKLRMRLKPSHNGIEEYRALGCFTYLLHSATIHTSVNSQASDRFQSPRISLITSLLNRNWGSTNI